MIVNKIECIVMSRAAYNKNCSFFTMNSTWIVFDRHSFIINFKYLDSDNNLALSKREIGSYWYHSCIKICLILANLSSNSVLNQNICVAVVTIYSFQPRNHPVSTKFALKFACLLRLIIHFYN